MATTETHRSNSQLHNYTMPRDLRWGNQRFLRCIKVNSDAAQISPLSDADNHSDQRRPDNCALQSRTARDAKRERGKDIDSCSEFPHRSRKVCRTPPPPSDTHTSQRFSGCDDGIAAMREKVMLDLQTAADQMKHAFFKDGLDEGEVCKPPPPAVESELSRPRNLRTRRADLKTSANIDAAGRKGPIVNSEKPNSGVSEMKAAEVEKSMRLRSSGAAKKDRPKFSVALSKNEIEEDFYSMVGRRPPRRPKKRNRNVQRNLDTLFPGLLLSEVTPNMY